MGKSNYGQGTKSRSPVRSVEKTVPAKRQPVRTLRKSKKEEDEREEDQREEDTDQLI